MAECLYALESLRRAADRVSAPEQLPPFPCRAEDPIAGMYELVKREFDAASTLPWNRHEAPPPDPSRSQLLTHSVRHDALLAVLRMCAWAQSFLKQRLRMAARATNWLIAETYFDEVALRLARADPKMSDGELCELSDYSLDTDTRHTFPQRAFACSCEFASRSRALPGIVYSALQVLHADKLASNNPYYAAMLDRIGKVMSRRPEVAQTALEDSNCPTEAFFDKAVVRLARAGQEHPDPRAIAEILDAGPARRSALFREAVRMWGWGAAGFRAAPASTRWNGSGEFRSAAKHAESLALLLLQRTTPIDLKDLTDAVVQLSAMPWGELYHHPIQEPLFDALRAAIRDAPDHGPLRRAMEELSRSVASIENVSTQKYAKSILDLLQSENPLSIRAGEAWADQALKDFEAMPPEDRVAWAGLVRHCVSASGSAPSKKWLKSAAELLRPTAREFSSVIQRWFLLVDKPRTQAYGDGYRHYEVGSLLLLDSHMEVLKGLCWIAGTIKDADLARALGKLALSCYRKVPGIGPRATKVGNAAVTALGGMPGMDSVGQLAMLRVKVKFGTAQKMIEKALNAAAEREGLPRDEIEELGVPSYGLTEVGKRTETLGEFTAEMIASGVGDVELRFLKPDGKGGMKAYASVPAAVKTEFAEDLKDLKAAAKDIAAMLPAQRDRIDAMFLENKSWAMGVWRERYLDHPLVGVLARRLIWRVSDGKGDAARAVTWLDDAGALVGVDGMPVAIDEASAIVRLWHPIDAPQEEVLAWRRFFEERQIRQPFKQAHREVYLLTDAERRTETYSNRFAAHIIRQHQFNALCGVRGWKNKLRLMVDAEYPPASRPLNAHGLRAEYWIEGIGEEYGQDTNEAGVYNLLVTDQVRFYRIDADQASAHAGGGGYGASWGRGEIAAGLPIEEIPALVLSEILRDVDLFVGVCSVGNNPQWEDGGPNGTHRDYWQRYSFGDLTEAGKGRYDILSRLLPRLKISGKCTLGEKFLTVRGSIRTYKIHLGSGNILMEPNDQYLCIVPSASQETKTGGQVFLPFEGDRTLAIILSKAFMLAEDDKIADASITRQIKG